MLDAMVHEPFYSSGRCDAQELGVYCAWIAQPDSFAARQPFTSDTGRTTIVISGECSASENLDNSEQNISSLYERCGEQLFQSLNGTFSGLLVDRDRNVCHLFNDRYRLERVYWHQSENAFYFASEAKALLRVLPQLRRFDEYGLAEFLRFGCTRGSRTLFSGISILPAASLWRFEEGQCRKQSYFSATSWEAQTILRPNEFVEAFGSTFKVSLPKYCQPGSKLGISLTAGIDNRLIMACLPPASESSVSYTFADKDGHLLDARIAARVAEECGIEHHVLPLESDFFSEFAAYAERTIYLTDGCLGPLGTHEIYFNKKARQLAPVRLTGVFGGEILRGVVFTQSNGVDRNVLGEKFAAMPDDLKSDESAVPIHPVTSAISFEIPERRFGVVAAGRSQTVFRTPYLDNELVALAYRMPPQLRASGQAQISVIENSNHKLSRIPTDMGLLGNDPLRNLMRRIHGRATFKLDYFYTEGFPGFLEPLELLMQRLNMPGQIIGRHKFLQYRRWFRSELADYVCSRLRAAAETQPRIWNTDCLQRIERELGASQTKRNWTYEINAILTLESVERQLFALDDDCPQTSSQLAPVCVL